MNFFKEVEEPVPSLGDPVPALRSYMPNSIIYTILYTIAIPPNVLLLYMGIKKGLINSRVRFPTLGMTVANLFGLFGFLLLNSVYLITILSSKKQLSLFTCSFVRTILYNSSYVCYFVFPVLAIDQYLYVCKNFEMQIRSLASIIGVCFAIPMLVGMFDLFLQDTVLYDFMFLYIKMSPYTNSFFFFFLAPLFFIFSFICNLRVLTSIIRRQSSSARQQMGRSLNPRQLQHYKGIVVTYTLQAFLPLVLATPYYIAYLCFMFNVEIDLRWFIVGEAIIGMHPLTNAMTTLIFLRPYRQALKKLIPLSHDKKACLFGKPTKYDSITKRKIEETQGNDSTGEISL